MHVNGSNRGILELDLATVMGNEEEKSALGMVKSLDLSKNELKVVSNMQPLTSLLSLDVSRNRISKVIGLPLGLTKLNVSHNQLTSIEGIATLPFLTELDISRNRIVSLGGLPRVSPLSMLNVSNNRLASLSGVEVLAKLQILHADHNYLCTVDDVKQLTYTATLKTVSLRGCPITELADYHAVIKAVSPSVLTLDGVSLKTPEARSSSAPRDQQASIRHVDGSIPPSHPPPPAPQQRGQRSASVASTTTGGGAPQTREYPVDPHNTSGGGDGLSFNGVQEKSEIRRQELTEQLRKAERDHNDTALLLQQERKENQMLHNKNRKLEQQLSEARRVLADELHQVAELREANHRLEEEALMQKSRAEKSARDYRYAQQKLRSEQRKRAEEVEKLSVNHESQIIQLQEQIRSNVDTTRRMVKEDQTQAREIEALNRKVASLQATNRTLQVEVSRLESELEEAQETTAAQEQELQRNAPSAYSQQVSDRVHEEENEQYFDDDEETRGYNLIAEAAGEDQHLVPDGPTKGVEEEEPQGEKFSRTVSRTEVTARPGSARSNRSTPNSKGHRLRDEVVEDDEEEGEQYFDQSPYHHSGKGRAASRLGGSGDDAYVTYQHPHPAPSRQQHQISSDSLPQAAEETSIGGSQFAQQLKSWLLSEIKSSGELDSLHRRSMSGTSSPEQSPARTRDRTSPSRGAVSTSLQGGGFHPVPRITGGDNTRTNNSSRNSSAARRGSGGTTGHHYVKDVDPTTLMSGGGGGMASQPQDPLVRGSPRKEPVRDTNSTTSAPSHGRRTAQKEPFSARGGAY